MLKKVFISIGVIVLIAIIVISAIILFPLNNEKEERYHQHISAILRPEDEINDGSFNTHLPLLVIDTDGQVNTAHMNVINNDDNVNRVDDVAQISSNINMYIDNLSSNYIINLVANDGTKNSQSLIGMDSNCEWELEGPFKDKTMIQNYLWYNIAGELMDYSPNVRFCEVVMDGEYKGLYLLKETITVGENDSRIKLEKNKKLDTYTGYLLRVNLDEEDAIKNLNTFGVYSKRNKMRVAIDYPNVESLTSEEFESIRQDFSIFEKVIYSYDFDNFRYGYKKFINIDSFADYFLLSELTCYYRASLDSTYIYKGMDGHYRMCIGDYKYSYDGNIKDITGFDMQYSVWYNMLIRDSGFVESILKRYDKFKNQFINSEYLTKYVDDVINYLGPAIDRNSKVVSGSFDDEINELKDFIKIRTNWIDNNIKALLQFSNNSKNKKFNENAN